MMNVYIPIADVTLTDGQTYDGQLPLWATRPLMVKVTTGTNEPVNITVRNSGANVKTVTLPYQQYGVDIDLSFAAPLLKRADRNKSQGTPWFMPQELLFWVDNPADYITIPVFHCDLTYWDTLGVDAALPQPIKPRIPGQTLDIFFPYVMHPSDALSVQIEPVTGAPSNVIFPTTYVLGDTIDITYIKKLTIKNVWGNGLDQVINYEDRLMSDVVYDTGLQCALRARWNMRNGQWFWGAFKDYFWSNKFTPIRGRGGVTEQAEITINLEYGEEYYNVYQELLVSSNVVFDLNIPGINQYQSKRFRAEVVGDTGARWSNSAKTYRQQVRFKTTELQDNYIFPQQPDRPPTPSIAFTAQKNPWTIGAAYAEGLVNSIYSNAAWEVQSTPSWLSVGEMVTLTANDFEQGGLSGAPGTSYEDMKLASSSYIRSKKPVPVYGKPVFIGAFVPGFNVIMFAFDADMKYISMGSAIVSGANRTKTINISGAVYAIFRVQKNPPSNIMPSDATTAQIGVSVNRFNGNAGTSNLTATVAANTGDVRSGNIVLESKAGSATYNISVTQAGISGNITATPSTIAAGYVHIPVTVAVTSVGAWSVSQRDTWITPSVTTGVDGITAVTLTIADNATNDPRTGTITFYNDSTGQIAVVTVNQDGKPTNIVIDPTRVTAPKTSGTVKEVACGSINGWTMIEKPSWVAVAPNNDAAGIVPVSITYTANSTGTKRSGYLKIQDEVTGEIAICIIEQEG